MDPGDILLLIIAIIFPPLTVLLKDGCTCCLLLNIVLTLLGWIPGALLSISIAISISISLTSCAACVFDLQESSTPGGSCARGKLRAGWWSYTSTKSERWCGTEPTNQPANLPHLRLMLMLGASTLRALCHTTHDLQLYLALLITPPTCPWLFLFVGATRLAPLLVRSFVVALPLPPLPPPNSPCYAL